MQIGMMIDYSEDFKTAVKRVQDLEKAGLDVVWVTEAYSFDAVSQVGYLAAQTERVKIGTGIINVYSRSASAIGQTAAGCDYLSDGRFILGLGASGPQVIEGFHGLPYEKPMPRIRDYIEVTRKVLRREPVVYEGKAIDVPLPEGQGTGLGKPLKLINHPVRDTVPIYWASLMGLSVTNTARHADGWLPAFFVPDSYRNVWGDDLDKGFKTRDPSLGPLEIAAGGMVAIDDSLTGADRSAVLDRARPGAALYVGGMGAREKNFYNNIVRACGYVDEAIEVQDLYLDGKKKEAEAALPEDLLMKLNLVGSPGFVSERIAAYREAGVTTLQVRPVGGDPVKTVEKLRALIDA